MTDSFDEYVRQRGPALLRFAYVLTGNAHLAEDVVQEALARCHRRWRRIEGVPDPYVRKAVVREYLSWRRRRSSTELAVADIPDRAATEAGPESVVAHRDALWSMLAGLPRMQRAVLVLRYLEDLADDGIAELLGCTRVTVRVHASRGLAKLRAALPAVELTGRKL